MKYLKYLLPFCLLLGTSCSKAADLVTKSSNKAQEAYSQADYKEAFKWYKQSAELGDADAMYLLAVMYYQGEGTLKDYKEAFKWFKRSAELGNANAMASLANRYSRGQGTLKDYKQAKYWIKKAYNTGVASAEESWNDLELWKY